MKRPEAYAWLASQLGISQSGCHIGLFDVNQCKKVIRAVAQKAVERMQS